PGRARPPAQAAARPAQRRRETALGHVRPEPGRGTGPRLHRTAREVTHVRIPQRPEANNPGQLIDWLEQRVLDLRCNDPQAVEADPAEVKAILGPHLPAVLAQGPRALGGRPDLLDALASRPGLLLGLRRLLFVAGS